MKSRTITSHDISRASRFAAIFLGLIGATFIACAKDTSHYVQDGLIACWDGVENAGLGQHAASTETWTDTIGNVSFALTNVVVHEDRMFFSGTAFGKLTATDTAATFALAKNGTVEVVYASTNGLGSQLVVQSSSASTISIGLYSGDRLIVSCASGSPTFTYTSGSKTNVVAVRYSSGKAQNAFINGSAGKTGNNNYWSRSDTTTTLGALSNLTGYFKGAIYAIRLYSRRLTDAELAANYAVDFHRFFQGHPYGDDALTIDGSPETFGSPTPPYGTMWGLAGGETRAVSAPAVWTNAAETVAATCVGWKLYDDDGNVVSNGAGNAFTYIHPDPIAYRRLEWQWDLEYKVTATAGAGGTASPAVQWVPEGGMATVTATPDAANLFAMWTGDIPNGVKYAAVATFPVTAPREVLANFAASGGGATWHWSGAGANALASNPTNWMEETVPTELANIVFDENGEGKPCSWNLDIPLQSWKQTNYTSTVTFRTVYNPNGFTVLRVLGDVTLASGTWKHLANATTYRQYRLYASVGGNMVIGTNATIDVTALGYSYQYRVGTGTFVDQSACGATYGGYAKWNSGTPSANGNEPYGSITAPEDPGSGARNGSKYNNGGGVVRLDVAGALALNGTILSNGNEDKYYTGSGGSVYIRAGTISGSGTISSNGRITMGAFPAGSGGRIAIILTAQGADFSAFDPVRQCTAISITTGDGTYGGAPGTIYAETPADVPGRGWLIFKDNGNNHSSSYCNANPFKPGVASVSATDYARITVTNNAKIYLAAGNTLDLRGLTFETPGTSGVCINGGTLIPAAGGNINYDVVSYSGLGNLDSPSVTFGTGASLAIATAYATYTGDMTIGAGVTATVGTSLTVDGDLVLNGTIRRPDGPFNTDPKLLDLHVTGDMSIGAAGLVDMSGRGFSIRYCPPGQTLAGSNGGSHGGRGWDGTKVATAVQTILPYGSITDPVTAGAGGGSYGAGGGIVRLVVDGDLVNDGAILGESASAKYYGPAGGSVNVRAGTLSGAGRISADCRKLTNAYGPGGGGRVAVRLTSTGADFTTFSGEISTRGARVNDNANQWVGGAGTVWLRTAAQGDDNGTLIVDNMKSGLTNWGDTPVGTSLVDGTSFGDVLVGRSARLNLADDATMYVSGVLSNGCQFVVGNGSTVVFTGEGESRLYGNLIFSNLTCNASGKTITVNDGATITLKGLGAFEGAVGSPVTIRSATPGGQWTLNVTGTGSVVMNGVALRGCQSTVEIIVMNGTDLGGNSANIIFNNVAAGELMTWTGAEDTSWATPGNWDRQRAPIATDRILIPSSASRMPVLAANTAAATLTVAQGASLDLAGRDLTVTGDVSIAGAFIASATEVFSVGGNLLLSDASTPAQSTIRLSGTTAQTVTSSGATLHALEVSSPAVAFSGNLACTSFSVGDGDSAFDLSFAQGMTLTANAFSALGDDATTNGVLRCATNGGTWNLTVNQADVSGVAVKGSDASRGVTIVPSDCRDDGGNLNWLFVDDRTHWDGTSWSRGEPTASIDAVVDPGASLTVSSPLATRGFTVSSGASVTVSSDFEAAGSVTLEGSSTMTWNVPGTIGGNLVLLPGATLTHSANSTKETYKLNLSVGGSGYVAAGANITASGRGYKNGDYGPGANGAKGASYGGRGYAANSGNSRNCYGSALCPTNCGSGGSYNGADNKGGGAIRLVFDGPLVLDGGIDANAGTGVHYTGSGGSVWLTAASLSGTGKISAIGGNGTGQNFGGGGRVALYLTSARSLDTFQGTVAIHGGVKTDTGNTQGSPGTYYLQTAADADGDGVLTSYSLPANTTIQASDHATEIAPAVLAREGETRRARVTASAYSYLYLVQDTRVGDIHLHDSTARLYLKGHTLKVNTRRHAVSPNDASQIIYGGGEIIWQQPGTIILLR